MNTSMHEYLKLDLDFVFLFHIKLDETSSVQPSNSSFVSKNKCFLYSTRTFYIFDLYTLPS